MLTAATMATLQKIDESFMSETLTIEDVAFVSDGAGSTTQSKTTRTTRGYFWAVSGDEAGTDQIKERGKHRVALPIGTVINGTSIIVRNDGRRYQVKYVFPLNTQETSQRVGLEDE